MLQLEWHEVQYRADGSIYTDEIETRDANIIRNTTDRREGKRIKLEEEDLLLFYDGYGALWRNH